MDAHTRNRPLTHGSVEPELGAPTTMLAASELDPAALNRAAAALADILDADSISLYIFDIACTRSIAHVMAGVTEFEREAILAAEDLPVREIPAVREIIRTRSPLARTSLDDWLNGPNPAGSPFVDQYADLVIPIVAGDRCVGVAYAWRLDADLDASPEQIERALDFMRHVGLSVLTYRRSVALQALSDLARDLSQSADVSLLCSRVQETVAAVFDPDEFSIAVHDESSEHIEYMLETSRGGRTAPAARSTGSNAISGVVRDGQSLLLHAASEQSVGIDVETEYGNPGAQASIHVPLRAGGEVFGVLSVLSTAPDAYRQEDVELLEAIASQAATAIRNAQLTQRSQARIDRLALLDRLNRTVMASLDLADTCGRLDAELRTFVPSDAFVILPDAALEDETPAPIYTRDPGGMLDGEVIRLLGPEIRAALSTGAPLACGGLPAWRVPAAAGAADDAPAIARSILIAPLRALRATTGLIVLAHREARVYRPEQMDLVGMVTQVASLSIGNARLYAAVDTERNRIGRLAEWQQALIRGGQILTHGGDIGSLIDSIAGQLERMLPHRSLAVYAMDAEPGKLTTLRIRADGAPIDAEMSLSLGQGLVGYSVLEGRPLVVNEAHRDPRSHYPPSDPADVSHGESFLAAPLIVDGATVGAVGMSREGSRPFSSEEFEVFTAFIPHLAVALQTARLVARNRSLLLATIRSLTATIDAKDPLTRGHSERVSRYARDTAAQLGMTAEEQDAVELAALLHDIGKIGVPDEILSKPGPLTAGERVMMMAHVTLGADILSGAGSPDLDRLVPLVRHHHEWHIGGGYPDGISGDVIPLGAAIIAVADAYDTMTTDRPYRQAMSVEAALEEVQRSAGTQFHPQVVQAHIDIVTNAGSSSGDGRDGQPRAISDAREPVSRITPIDVRPVSVLYRIASEIASISELDAFLSHAVRIISEEMSYSNVSILLPAADGVNLIVRADVWPDGQSLVGWEVPIEHSLTGWVFRTAQVANVSDTLDDPRFFAGGAISTASELSVPLVVDGEVVGVINVEASVRHAFTSLDERLMVAIAAQIAPALQLARVHDDVKRAAQRDGLTGIYNHAAFYARLEELLDANARVALFIFDVEGLKRVNDTAGHLAGDNVLRRIAITLEMATRPDDMVARYGGDEFAVIATGIDEAAAIEMAGRLQAAVNQLTWGSGAEHIRISVGLAFSAGEGAKATELVALADCRMYDARYQDRAARGVPIMTQDARTQPSTLNPPIQTYQDRRHSR